MNALKLRLPTSGRRGALGFALLVALGTMTACDGLLEVELPASLTEDVLDNPVLAESQVYSSVAYFECGFSDLVFLAMGFEDVFERVSGTGAVISYPDDAPAGGGCSNTGSGASFYNPMQVSRVIAQNVYQRLESEWTVAQVPKKVELQGLSALMVAANIGTFGEFFCEVALDGGPLLNPDQILAEGERWIGLALGHISAGGDFAIDGGNITSSAQTMAYGLRARMRWARGDLAGALADASLVPVDYEAKVTRDVGPDRRNKVAYVGYINPVVGGFHDINDWWNPLNRLNPVTGVDWPAVIPFSGYWNLGIDPDGRAITPAMIPIRTHVDLLSVDDTRVPTVMLIPSGSPIAHPQPAKWTSEDDDIPWVSWREMWLIRAEVQGGQAAIDLVNDLRTLHSLPLISGAYELELLGDPVAMRIMLLEERRRELHAEGGRWWSGKLRNPDVGWFPRFEGVGPTATWPFYGGVSMIMNNSEYEANPNFTLDDRATMCDPDIRPYNIIGNDGVVG